MIKSPRKNVPDVGIELGAACMPSEHASDRATAPGQSMNTSKICAVSVINMASEELNGDYIIEWLVETPLYGSTHDSLDR